MSDVVQAWRDLTREAYIAAHWLDYLRRMYRNADEIQAWEKAQREGQE